MERKQIRKRYSWALMAGVWPLALLLPSSWALRAAEPAPTRFEARAQGRPMGEDKAGREAWLLRQRALPGEAIPLVPLREAVVRESLCLTAQEGPLTWETLGPDPVRNITMVGAGDLTVSGRTLAVALDPSDDQAILLGTAQGGIWRSGNGGAHFEAVGDNLPSLAIKVIRFAPSDPDIVYAGSGEPHSKTSIFGMGVFKSADGGRSWSALPDRGEGWDFRYVEISGLQVDPRDADTLYVATANVVGDRVDPFKPPPWAPPTGIFKSTDGGQSWRCTRWAEDYRPYDFPAYDPFPASGTGFVDLELYRANPDVLFAAERSGGIYRSLDAGEHWTRLTPAKNPSAGPAMGADFPAPVPSFHHFDGNAAAFTEYPVLRRPTATPEFNRIEIGLAQSGAGLTADPRTCVLYAGYGSILLLDANGSGAYESGADLQDPVALLFKSSDGGDTWTWLGDWFRGGTPLYCDAAPGGTENALYDNMVEVNPENPDDVVVGGNPNYNTWWPDPLDQPERILAVPWTGMVYRSVDGGRTWVDTTPACTAYEVDPDAPPMNGLPVYRCKAISSSLTIHPDLHGAAYDWPNRRLWVVHDGGLSVATLGGDGTDPLNDYRWESKNEGLSTLQVFLFGSHPTDPNQVLAGMQDNSNAYWNGAYWDAWDWNVSDGTVARWDPVDPSHVFIGWQYALARHDGGGGKGQRGWKTLFDSSIGQGDTPCWVTVFAIDPVHSNVVYVGSETGLYRSVDRGDHFLPRLNASPLDGSVTAISVSPKNPDRVWAGTSTGRLYLFDVGTGKVTDRTGKNFPNRWISAIEASSKKAQKALVTFSGYDASSLDTAHGGNGKAGKVFVTTDLGKRWQSISGNLDAANQLDIPLSSLAVDPKEPKRMWVGTDTGVYWTQDGGKRWASYRGNMPIVAVLGVEVNRTTGYLHASTFGRGIWRSLLPKS